MRRKSLLSLTALAILALPFAAAAAPTAPRRSKARLVNTLTGHIVMLHALRMGLAARVPDWPTPASAEAALALLRTKSATDGANLERIAAAAPGEAGGPPQRSPALRRALAIALRSEPLEAVDLEALTAGERSTLAAAVERRRLGNEQRMILVELRAPIPYAVPLAILPPKIAAMNLGELLDRRAAVRRDAVRKISRYERLGRE